MHYVAFGAYMGYNLLILKNIEKRGRNIKMKRIEWICTYCGKRSTMSERMGRPQPGKCPRKQGDKPHSWRKNKTFQ